MRGRGRARGGDGGVTLRQPESRSIAASVSTFAVRLILSRRGRVSRKPDIHTESLQNGTRDCPTHERRNGISDLPEAVVHAAVEAVRIREGLEASRLPD